MTALSSCAEENLGRFWKMTQKATSFLAGAVLLFLVSIRDAQSECVSNALRELSSSDPNILVVGSSVSIFPDLPFTCEGRITSWSAVARKVESSASNTARTEFQVWRPVPASPQTFTLAASLPVVEGKKVPGSPEYRFLTVEFNAAVYVQRGDIVGVFTPSGSEHSLVVDEVSSGESVQWITEVGLSRAFCTFEACSSRVVGRTNIVPKFEISIDGTITGTSPPINDCQEWLFDPCDPSTTAPTSSITTSTPSNRTMSTTPTQTTDSGVGGAVAAGVIFGLLVIIGVVVVIMIVSILLWKRQKDRGIYETKREVVNCYETNAVTAPIPVDCSNGRLPVANEPQYAPINSTIRDRTVSQHYEFENDPVLNPMYRPSFHNKLHNRPYPRRFPPAPLKIDHENKPHEYAVLEGPSPTNETAPALPMSYAVPLIHGGDDTSGDQYSKAPSEQDPAYATLKGTSNGSGDSYWEPSENEREIYTHLARGRYLEISSDSIKLGEFLGKGQFALVHKAVWASQCGEIEVAVKELKRGASDQDRVQFLREAAIMGQFNHTGIIKLYGVVKEKKPHLSALKGRNDAFDASDQEEMIILEYLPKGNLREYLNNAASSSFQNVPRQLLKFGRQIASGMNYLAGKGFIHRDLAARNILLTQDCSCKIADFGMSRDLAHQDYYFTSGGRIPLKWTAPEALTHRKYSTTSDVWSFGVVLFEIWSIGKKPYSGTANQDVLKLLLEGHRMSPPPGCPRGIYQLMMQCWNPEPSKRPLFSSITEHLSQDDLSLLHIHSDDQGLPPAAYMLGAPIEKGRLLYKDLQELYLTQQSITDQAVCRDYEVPANVQRK